MCLRMKPTLALILAASCALPLSTEAQAAPASASAVISVQSGKLTGGLGRAFRRATEQLDQVDKMLRLAGKDKLGAWKAANSSCTDAADTVAKGERDYAGKPDLKHSSWVAVTARLKASQTMLQAYYDKEVEGGGTDKDGSKKSGYDDSQSVIAATSPNKKSVDRAIWKILMATESVKKIHAISGLTSDKVSVANRSVENAKSMHARLLSSYGSIINKESDQYRAICSEIETSEKLAKELPAMAKAFAKAEEAREAAEKLAKAEAKRLSKAEYDAALAKRRKATLEAARFPRRTFEDKSLEKLVRETITSHYSNQTLLRLQVDRGYVEKQEARIVGDLIEYGTYRYMRATVAMQRKNGQVWVFRLKLRNTRLVDRTWGPQEVSGSFAGQYQMLSVNVAK